jgi:hypothetical protein
MGNLKNWEARMMTADQIKKHELSRTWKDRHAKGVPVKMSILEWREFLKSAKRIEHHRPGHSLDSVVTVHISDWNDESGPEAIFCNFRYKPEWLHKPAYNTVP